MVDEWRRHGSICRMCGSDRACPDQPGNGTLYDTSKFCGGASEGGESGRCEALESLGFVDTPQERKFDAITALMKEVFDTPCSHLVFVDPTRCWFKSWQGRWCEFEQDDGRGPYVQCPREDGWCNYILVPTTAEILVIEDASKDARFSLNTFVVGAPHFKFYAGAPLVGSRGERYGTLCVVDFVPRAFTAEQYALLINFAHLAVEELERNKPLHDKIDEAAVNNVWRNRHLDLSLQAMHEGILMLDMRESNWPIVYTNAQFELASGLSSDALVGHNFWDIFQQSKKTRLEFGLVTGLGDTFEVSVWCGVTERWLTLQLFPATSDRLAPSKAAGIPSWAPFLQSPPNARWALELQGEKMNNVVDHVKCFWFAMVLSQRRGSQSTCISEGTAETLPTFVSDGTDHSKSSSETLSWESPETSGTVKSSGYNTPYCEYHLPAELGVLQLGPLLGSGSFGKVYRAFPVSGEQVVALKVVDCRQRCDDDSVLAQLREVQLSCSLQHRQLVQVLSYATSTDMAGGRKIDIVWMVQEFCDLGTLTSAVERGWFRKERKITSPADMSVVLPTLLDIAKGMEFVHSHYIIHADLTGRNVLLSSDQNKPGGFSAKVCDFGMSRYTHGQALRTKDMGTVTHMPPEILRLEDSLIAPESDVWAFGVIAWEMYHGKRCYCGKNTGHILLAIVDNTPLHWEVEAPQDFPSLMKRCLAYEYKERPPFSAVVTELDSFIKRAGMC